MTILAPPPGFDITRPNRDLSLAIPQLRARAVGYQADMSMRGFPTLIIEVFRYDARQQWEFGKGRGPAELIAHGVPAIYAQPTLAKTTDAWSAATSAHGYTESGIGGPIAASCAMDIVPVGHDGKPFTPDDPWAEFIGALEEVANEHGLRHFRNAAGHINDLDHLQLIEYNDLYHQPVFPREPLAA